ncbi:MAG: TIGR03936 family radical SAM-associated protein [Candidatus Gorgyraea atricola]|nr:TIGR03936 family radical SAM-associated protein [Candidatus Gorgyraea atricola]
MKLEATFCKRGDLRYISHLDIVRLFQRSVRRASLPVSLSQGFSPHYKISFGQALKLGVESESEKAGFSLDKWIEPDEFMNRINGKLPEEVRIVECRKRF